MKVQADFEMSVNTESPLGVLSAKRQVTITGVAGEDHLVWRVG